MAIRTELLNPTNHVFGPTPTSIVSEHGTIMMMMASSIVVGPLGNWLVPLMIGSRRMAFPRVEAFSLWIFVAGYLVILGLPLRWLPDGLDRLRAPADPGDPAWTPTWSASPSSASA
jgi:heme/copper-type cytochrome/quinol oxidase subunit 1